MRSLARIAARCGRCLAALGGREGRASGAVTPLAPGTGMRDTSPITALELMLEAIAELRPLAERIRRLDRSLADQLRRAASSTALNLAEADGSDAGNRRARLHTALGSLSETRAALRVAAAWGYVDGEVVAVIDTNLDRVAATSWRRLEACGGAQRSSPPGGAS